MIEIQDFIHLTDKDQRQQMQDKLIDAEDDDFNDLQSPNKQQLELLIRQLKQGQQIQIPDLMQLGGYLQDIAISICKYEYSDLEEIINLIIKLTDMSAVVEDKIYDELKRQENEFEKQIQNIYFEKVEDAIKFYNKMIKHFGLLISLHEIGFDSKHTKLFEFTKMINKHIVQLASGIESEAMVQVGLQSYKINWEYVINVYFSSLYQIMLMLFTEEDSKIKIKEEMIQKSINDGKLNIKIQTRDEQRIAEPYIQFIGETHRSLEKMYQAIKFLNDQVTQLLRTRNDSNANTIKQIAQKNTVAVKSFNKILNLFNSNKKQIVCSQVLSDKEEIELINLFKHNKSKQLRVIKTVKTQLSAETLYSSNSTQAQFQFSYPVEYYKEYLEDLIQVTIKHLDPVLEKIDLLQHNIVQYIQLCKTDDDIEYLAYLVVKRYSEDIQNMKQNLYHQLFQSWDETNAYNLVRFMATIIYNGHQIEYVDEDEQKHQLTQDLLNIDPKRILGIECQYFQLINQMLIFRLISTVQIWQQASQILKYYQKADEQNKQQLFVLFIQFLTATYEECGIYDVFYLPNLKKILESSIGKKIKQQNDIYQIQQLIKEMNKYNERVMQRREVIQQEEEQRERERKEQAYLAKLQKSNPKQYDKIMKKKQKEREKKEQEELKEKLEKQKKEEEKQNAPKYERIQQIIIKCIDQLQQCQENEKQQYLQQFKDDLENLKQRIVKYNQYLLQKHTEKQQQGAISIDKTNDVPAKLFKYLIKYMQDLISISNIDQISQIYSFLNSDLLYSGYIKKLKYEATVLASQKTDDMTILCKLMIIMKQKNNIKQQINDLEYQLIQSLKIKLHKQLVSKKYQFKINQDCINISDQKIDILNRLDQERQEQDELTDFINIVQQCLESPEEWVTIDSQIAQNVISKMEQKVQNIFLE